MKLRKAIKMVAAGAAVTASASVLAVPTTGNWSVSGGVITAACPANYTCATAEITDSGFMQRQITDDTTGRTYIQSILTEGDSTDGSTFAGNTGFADESFVEIGGGEGIISRQLLAEQAVSGAVTEDFNSESQIFAGQFRVADSAAIQIDQTVAEADTADVFSTGFQLIEMDNSSFGGNITAQATVTGALNAADFTAGFKQTTFVVEDTTGTYAADNWKRLDADQTLVGDVQQTMALRERTGAAISQSGSTDGATGTNAEFAAGDTIVSLRIAQDVSGAGSFGLDDFVNETTGVENGIDSFTTSGVPFQTVTFSDGSDPFAAF